MLQCKRTILPLFIAGVLACFGLLPKALAVSPSPPGGYPNFTTAAGDNALQALTLGVGNTAIGTLLPNTADANTATGAAALLSNTTGGFNTASGALALFSNTTGFNNTAIGSNALKSNTTGYANTATGNTALSNNTTGFDNIAYGGASLLNNTTGDRNTAIGDGTLASNTTGGRNTAAGYQALESNTTGNSNTAVGRAALGDSTGNSNIALGFAAGSNLTTGDSNIDIGNAGVAAEANTIRIGDTQTATYIAGISVAVVAGAPVVVNSPSGQLGVAASSARFKDTIKAMDKASEAILALKPVTFHYKKELDPASIPQFGLVAEEVEKVNPDLVIRDNEGKPYSVRYDAVNAMLLNEFLKEHRRVEEQQATITQLKSTAAQQVKDFQATVAQLTARLDEQAAQIQKVSAQLEASKPAPQVVKNP